MIEIAQEFPCRVDPKPRKFMEGIVMKRFAALALILCIGLFTIGCAEKQADTKPAGDAKVEADADGGSAEKTYEAAKEETTE